MLQAYEKKHAIQILVHLLYGLLLENSTNIQLTTSRCEKSHRKQQRFISWTEMFAIHVQYEDVIY